MSTKAMAIGIASMCMMMTMALLPTAASAWSLPIPPSVVFTGYDNWATGQPAGTQWFAVDGDTGLCQWGHTTGPSTSLFFYEYPLSVAANGYNYQSDHLTWGSEGWAEARFTFPALAEDAYSYYHLRLYLLHYEGNMYSVSYHEGYYFGVLTPSGQSLLSEHIVAYDSSNGQYTYDFWANNSPDTGYAWTKAEIGDLQLRLIAYLHDADAEPLKAYRFYGLAIPVEGPDLTPVDLILRPDGDYLVDESWECHPAAPATFFDKVNETDSFGDWEDTYVMSDLDDRIAFTFTDIPATWDDTVRFSMSVWVVAWVDYEFELQYPLMAFAPVGLYGLPAVWSPHYIVSPAQSNYTYDWDLNPDTGYAWSVAELNGLRVMIDTDAHQGGYMNITQVGVLLTLVEGLGPIVPDEEEGWSYDIHSIRVWLVNGGVGWIFLLLGGGLMVATPVAAVVVAKAEGYVEGLGRFLIMGLIGFGFLMAGLVTGTG